jgi:hypothetical protein
MATMGETGVLLVMANRRHMVHLSFSTWDAPEKTFSFNK